LTQPAPLRAVLFDLDGTLYPLRPLRWRFALRYPWRVRTLLALARAREGLRREGLQRPDLWTELERRAAADLRCPPAEVARRWQRILEHEWPAVLRRVGPYPGMRGLLDWLVQRKTPIGVLSDYPVAQKLVALGLADLPWKLQLDASALGALKPHPEPFHQALAGLGLPPAEVLYVGARLDSDVTGARPVGLIPALLCPRGPAPPPPLLVVRTPDELRRELQGRLARDGEPGGGG